MKSTSGHYFIGLDHIRALAAFMVFAWHFIHVNDGQLADAPLFPLSILAEGHTGVALFMTLSGYLFAKLLDGKTIIYSKFILNRCLRLLPLLAIVMLYAGSRVARKGHDMDLFIDQILAGSIFPTLPNGGWSITAEFHFYVILPALLWITHRYYLGLLGVLFIAIAFRALWYWQTGEIQHLAYWTIVGRLDQFLLGILGYQFAAHFTKRHTMVGGILFGFLMFYTWFDTLGGKYNNGGLPSPSPLWIIIPTLEGRAYAAWIAWYDTSFKHSTGQFSRFIAAIGTYSYSIYLLHFFFVFKLGNSVSKHLVPLDNLHLAILFSIPTFLVMVPIGYLSYRFIEKPFLRFRVPYIVRPHE